MRPRRSRAWAIALFASAGLAAAWGCSLVTSYDGFSGAAPCGKHVPGPPASDSPGDVGALVGVGTNARFENEGGAELGFDLDGLCTCHPDKAACTGKKVCDPDDDTGTDNALGTLVNVFSAPPQARALVDQLFRSGLHGLLFELKGWSGKPDDKKVTLSVFNVAGVNGSNDGGAQAGYDGNDVFDVASNYLVAPSPPLSLVSDDAAYVTGGTLVAHFPNLRFRYISPSPAGLGAVEIDLDDAILVGKPAKRGANGLAFDELQITGRMGSDKVLADLSILGQCPDGGFYQNQKTKVCAAMDLPAAHASDGKSSPCVSGSLAFGIAVAPAKIGGAVPVPLGPDLCGAAADTCP